MKLLLALIFSVSILTAVAQDQRPLLISGFGKTDSNNGEIFAITGNGQKQTLKTFGFNPNGGVIDHSYIKGTDGKIYGVSSTGGTDGFGVIFRFNTDGTGYEVIHTFNKDNISRPLSNLIQLADGRLLGIQMSNSWSSTTMPRAYRVNTDGSNFELLTEFPRTIDLLSTIVNTPDGIFGVGRVSNYYSFIYKLNLDGTGFSVLYDMPTLPGTTANHFLLYGSNGYLYGSTNRGGAADKGTIYRLKTDGTDYSVIREMGSTPSAYFRGNLVELDGFLYGSCGKDPAEIPTSTTFGIFKMSLDGTSFDYILGLASDYGNASTGLSKTSDGKFLFTVNNNYANVPELKIMKVEKTGANLTLLKAMPARTHYDEPRPWIDDGGGNYFGAVGAVPTIARIRDNGDYMEVKKFPIVDGSFPNSDLVMMPDGFMVGVTAYGGEFDRGVIYKMKRDGSDFAVLHNFDYALMDVFDRNNPLMLASNGYLYGVITRAGGMSEGTLYRIKPDGTDYSAVYVFNSVAEGGFPVGAVVEKNGRLYGTLSGGGPKDGTLFSINLNGTDYVSHHYFDGYNDFGGTKELTPGVLVGHTVTNGANNAGYIYKYDIAGNAFTKLFDFTSDMQYVWNSHMVRYGNNMYALFNVNYTTIGMLKTDADGTNGASIFTLDAGASARNSLTFGNDGYLYWAVSAGQGKNRIYRTKAGTTENDMLYEFDADPTRATSTVGLLALSRTPQEITFPEITQKMLGTPPFNPGATASSGLAITYESSNPLIATIVNGEVKILKAGTVTITARQAGTLFIEPASLSRTFVILQGEVPYTVTGRAVLDFGSDHSGITISFVPKSPSAVATSATTNASGEFTAHVKGGVYDIVYSKTLFQTITQPGIFISEDMNLSNTVTLISKPVVNVCGAVSGVWTAANTYRVTCDIEVVAGTGLKIEPGTNVTFDAGKSMTVNGKFSAVGTKQLPILFTSSAISKARGDWKQITFGYEADTAKFSWCTIEYGGNEPNQVAMISTNKPLVMDHCIVRRSSYAGLSKQSSEEWGIMSVTNSLFTENKWVGVSCEGCTVYDSEMSNNDLFGMTVRSNSIAKGNKVHHNNYMGMQSYGNNVTVIHNLFYENKNGLGYGLFVGGFKSTIRSNTFYNNKRGLGFYDNDISDPGGTVTSNIFANNTEYAIYCEANDHTPEVVEYNLYHNNGNFFNYGIPGLGVLITQNANGLPSDTFYNFSAPPDFFSTTESDLNFLYLKNTSGAIDAGNPDFEDPDGSIADCGAIPYQKFEQEITFNTITTPQTFGDPDIILVANSSSGLPVKFSTKSTSVVTIEGETLRIIGAGTATIAASQAGNDEYAAADSVKQVIVINKKSQKIEGFAAIADITRIEGSQTVTLTGTATSGLAVAWSTASDKVTISSSTVTIVKPGKVTIAANQAGNGNYLAADKVEQTFCINPIKPSVATTMDIAPSLPRTFGSTAQTGTHQWFKDGVAIPGATNKDYVASEDGTYSVQNTVDGCSTMSEGVLFKISGIEDVIGANIDIYPNPAVNEIIVRVDGTSSNEVSIQLHDVLGRPLDKRSSFTGRDERFDISRLDHGVFLFRITIDNNIVVRKFIKK